MVLNVMFVVDFEFKTIIESYLLKHVVCCIVVWPEGGHMGPCMLTQNTVLFNFSCD